MEERVTLLENIKEGDIRKKELLNFKTELEAIVIPHLIHALDEHDLQNLEHNRKILCKISKDHEIESVCCITEI